MPLLGLNLAALAVATIFYTYRDQYLVALRRARMLRERVTYMLWTASQRVA
jgi:hypothetical protein